MVRPTVAGVVTANAWAHDRLVKREEEEAEVKEKHPDRLHPRPTQDLADDADLWRW
jgi:methionine-rich copper-binding protein CopC